MRLRLIFIGWIGLTIMSGLVSSSFAETLQERYKCPLGEIPEGGCYNQAGYFVTKDSQLRGEAAALEKKRLQKQTAAKLANFAFPSPMMQCDDQSDFFDTLVVGDTFFANAEARAKLLGKCLMTEARRNYALLIDFLGKADIASPGDDRERLNAGSWTTITIWDHFDFNHSVCDSNCYDAQKDLIKSIQVAAERKQAAFMQAWTTFRATRLRPAIEVETIPTADGDVAVDDWLNRLEMVLKWRTERDNPAT